MAYLPRLRLFSRCRPTRLDSCSWLLERHLFPSKCRRLGIGRGALLALLHRRLFHCGVHLLWLRLSRLYPLCHLYRHLQILCLWVDRSLYRHLYLREAGLLSPPLDLKHSPSSTHRTLHAHGGGGMKFSAKILPAGRLRPSAPPTRRLGLWRVRAKFPTVSLVDACRRLTSTADKRRLSKRQLRRTAAVQPLQK